MTHKLIRELLESGREIEFYFGGRHYSITYGIDGDSEEETILFSSSEDYPVKARDFDNLRYLEYDGMPIIRMLEEIEEEDAYIY